ncbi:MAG: hypothetical protein H0U53_10890 [Actinobacteria bacterium]|nr:hypothetical protein [Actinomycetota bacterium]
MSRSERRRKYIHWPMLTIWLVPGAVVSWLLQESVPWVVFMSWFAIIYAIVGALAADAPTELED